MVKITITKTSKKGPSKTVEFQVEEKTLVSELRLLVQKEFKVSTERQRLVDGDKKVLSDDSTLEKYTSSLVLKDLGPQISWKTVFIIEYAGPIFIHLAIYLLPGLFYGQAVEHSLAQKVMVCMAVAHYLKREYETFFIHRFSHATMPFTNIFKNCTHYYIFGGVMLGYFNYGPAFAKGSVFDTQMSTMWIVFSVIGFIFFELSNMCTHAILRNLRPPGTKIRRIPRGYGFNLVSCPNYLFEILSWVFFSFVSGSWASWFFVLVSSVQMYFWAVKKHSIYKKEFPNYPKNRKALIPFIA